MKVRRVTEYDVRKYLRDIQKTELRVGFFESSKYDDDKNTPIASVAYNNEFGVLSKGIPPRPFLRPTLRDNKAKWFKDISILSQRMIKGKMTPLNAFETLGNSISGQIKASISAVTSPPIAESTKKARLAKASKGNIKNLETGFKPLEDTGAMRNAVFFEVTQ